MKSKLQNVIAGSVSLALLGGSALVASAASTHPVISTQTVVRPSAVRPYGPRVRPFVTTPLVLGGGATLPIPAYLGLSEATGTTNTGLAGSIFGYFATQASGLNVEYCATGSGKGKAIFDGESGDSVNTPCANAVNASAPSYGFFPASGQPTPSPKETYPALAGTDAPMSSTDYDYYFGTDHPPPWEPVEFPPVIGAIAIAYNSSSDHNAPTTELTVTEKQICQIYAGQITKFGQLFTKPPYNTDTTPIAVVFRSDGSGTSFNFSNHLATVCPGQGVSNVYGANQTFTSADNSLPAGALGVIGNAAVIAAVSATPTPTTPTVTFGYVEAGYLSTLSNGATHALVTNTAGKTYDPITGLPAAANSITSTALQTNVQVVQTVSKPGIGGGPATTELLTATPTPAPPVPTPPPGVPRSNCVEVVKPSAYANPSTGYSIVAVSYLLFNSTGNGTKATDLKQLVTDLTTPSLFKGGSSHVITTVDASTATTGTTGYSSLGSTFSTPLQGDESCIGT